MYKFVGFSQNHSIKRLEKIFFLIRHLHSPGSLVKRTRGLFKVSRKQKISSLKHNYEKKIQNILTHQEAITRLQKLSMHWHKNTPATSGKTPFVSVIDSVYKDMILNFGCFSLSRYTGISLLPKSGRKNLIEELMVAKCNVASSGVVTSGVKELNKWRKILNFQSHEEFIQMFQTISRMRSGEILHKKGSSQNHLYFTKNEDNKRLKVIKIENEFYFASFHPVFRDDFTFASYLEKYGFKRENIEIIYEEILEIDKKNNV